MEYPKLCKRSSFSVWFGFETTQIVGDHRKDVFPQGSLALEKLKIDMAPIPVDEDDKITFEKCYFRR